MQTFTVNPSLLVPDKDGKMRMTMDWWHWEGNFLQVLTNLNTATGVTWNIEKISGNIVTLATSTKPPYTLVPYPPFVQ